MTPPKYSIIIPVYNRPGEVDELLESLMHQTNRDFEVILVEDGSSITCEKVFEKYAGLLSIQYFYKPNSGPGPSRNFGFERASGQYFVVFDSDCIIPPHYFEAVDRSLNLQPLDAWGGPDRGSGNFSITQQAMAYSMSSILTTGGIRGGSARGFQPRSFNMGISRPVFEKTGGFKFSRLAEDIELSVRMQKAGFRVGLIPDAYVYHKRRTDFGQFFTQVSNFGKGRSQVGRVHPDAIKLTHWFPSFFLTGIVLLPLVAMISPRLCLGIAVLYTVYLAAIAVDAAVKTRSTAVALLAIPAAIIQLTGYGLGFLKERLNFGA